MNWIVSTCKVLPYVWVKVRSKGSIQFIKDLILSLLGRYLLSFLSWISESIYTFWFSCHLARLERGTIITHFPLISKCYSNWLIKLFSFFSPILTTTKKKKRIIRRNGLNLWLSSSEALKFLLNYTLLLTLLFLYT